MGNQRDSRPPCRRGWIYPASCQEIRGTRIHIRHPMYPCRGRKGPSAFRLLLSPYSVYTHSGMRHRSIRQEGLRSRILLSYPSAASFICRAKSTYLAPDDARRDKYATPATRLLICLWSLANDMWPILPTQYAAVLSPNSRIFPANLYSRSAFAMEAAMASGLVWFTSYHSSYFAGMIH